MNARIEFTYYFFKEKERTFDLSELLAFFSAMEHTKYERKSDDLVIEYNNTILNFGASFIVSKRSVLSDLHLLDGKYLDINLRLELHQPIMSTAKLAVLIDIVGKMCQRFNFAVYNQLFENVSPFKKTMLIKAYDLFKSAYKGKYEEDFTPYSKLEVHALENITLFLLDKNNLNDYYQNENLKCLEYRFFKEKGTRHAYAAASWNGIAPFILPPNVSFIILQNAGSTQMINYKDFIKKLGRLLKPLDSNSKLLTIHETNIKKARKVISSTTFKSISMPLDEIVFEKIIDI